MFPKICSLYSKGCRTVEHVLRNPLGFGILIAILLQTACATTQINTVWKNDSSQLVPKKIMIIGITKLPRDRRILEDELVKQIKARGTDAVESYNILPDDKDSDKETIAQKIKEQGADSVLITRLADKKTIYTCLAPDNFCPPSFYETWHDYYWFGARYAHSDDYLEKTQYAIIETNLYDAVNDKLIWSASSNTEINGSDRGFIKSYVHAILKNLVERKLLKQQ